MVILILFKLKFNSKISYLSLEIEIGIYIYLAVVRVFGWVLVGLSCRSFVGTMGILLSLGLRLSFYCSIFKSSRGRDSNIGKLSVIIGSRVTGVVALFADGSSFVFVSRVFFGCRVRVRLGVDLCIYVFVNCVLRVYNFLVRVICKCFYDLNLKLSFS